MLKREVIYDAAAIILAAGNSSRMHFPKSLLPYSASENFLIHIARVNSEAGVSSVIAVVRPDVKKQLAERDNILIVVNDHPETGRMYSLKLGLSFVKDQSWCFVQNVDNPFITVPLLKSLYENRFDGDFIIPCYKGKCGHPVLISTRIMESIRNMEITDQVILRDVLKRFISKKVEMSDGSCIININTRKEFNRYFSGLKSETGINQKDRNKKIRAINL